MLYITIEDFYAQAESAVHLTREQERACAAAMAAGDTDARRRLIQSYLPYVASAIRRAPADIRTLHTVYAAIAALEMLASKRESNPPKKHGNLPL